VAFDVVPDRTLDILDEWVDVAAGSTLETITEDSARWLRGAHKDGLSIPDIADKLNDELYDGRLEGYVAERAARTGTISTSNAGAHSAHEDADSVVGEQWLTSIDGRERDSHAQAHQQVVAVGTSFEVGGVYLDHPGDPRAGQRDRQLSLCDGGGVRRSTHREPTRNDPERRSRDGRDLTQPPMTASRRGAARGPYPGVLNGTMTQTEPRRSRKPSPSKRPTRTSGPRRARLSSPTRSTATARLSQARWHRGDVCTDPDDGVMHYRFADDDAELVRNEIIDEPETIGGKEYAAGSWIITRKYHDDELWALVDDGVLTGFSIGGEVSEEVERSADELGDGVNFPAEVRIRASEILNGYTAEISDVDIPAVPNADHAEKSLTKNLVERAGDEESFVEMMEPGGTPRRMPDGCGGTCSRRPTRHNNHDQRH